MSGETNPNRIRDDEIYVKRMRGAKVADLAREYDLSDSMISMIVRRVSMSMPERDRSELLARSVEHLDFIQRKVMDLLELTPAPVTAGNMGIPLVDPDSGEVVRDHSLRRAALDQLMKINQIYAKRLGLDAPAEANIKAGIRIEIEGVATEDLT